MRPLKVYIILLLAATLTANAQQTADKQKSVYLEVFGASNLAGLNYDSRFKAGSPWGYRVGLGYTYSKSYSMFSGSNSLNGANVPMEINYLLGKKRSRLELGFGLNLGYYTEKYDTWNTKLVGDYNGIPYYETEYAGEASHSTWGALLLRQHRLPLSALPRIPVPRRYQPLVQSRRRPCRVEESGAVHQFRLRFLKLSANKA